MRIRTRLVAALLALLALPTSLVGQLATGVCAEPVSGAAMAVVVEHHPAAADHAAAAQSGHEHGDHQEPARGGGAGCPMAAAVGTSCGISALPASPDPVTLPVDPTTGVVPASDREPASLEQSSLFRPPRS